jgi:DNA-binding transcriptional ArsR family regulator
MFEGVISSKTKANILVKLFLNPGTKAYLRELASEFGVSTNSVRTELNTLTEHDILVSERDGRNVFYRANTRHPLFPELSSMVRKITGIDELARSVIQSLGCLQGAYLTGDYARGQDTGIIDVVLIGDIDHTQLEEVVRKSERYIKRKVRTLILNRHEFEKLIGDGRLEPRMKLWEAPTAAEPSASTGGNAPQEVG